MRTPCSVFALSVAAAVSGVAIVTAQRGAAPTDGGAIVAEALRREFPRQVYIANEKPGTEIPPLGNATYRFIFWDAYFKGWLLGGAVRAAAVRDELWHQDLSVHAVLLGTGYLDRLLRFQDFWNRMAMEKFNSVPSQYAPAPPGLFSPRKLFQDTESDVGGYDEGVRYRPEARDREMEILRATAGSFYEATADGGWQMMPLKRSRLTRSYARAFPQPLHSRTLLLVGRDSPYYRDQLTPAAARRDEQSIRETVELMRDGGYAALDYGRDFSVEDYGDRTHLAVSGGRKLAEAVAPAVRAISPGSIICDERTGK